MRRLNNYEGIAMNKGFESAADLRFVDRQGLDRLETTCELVVFADENPVKLVHQMQQVLNGEDICSQTGLKWISYHSQDRYNSMSSAAERKYRAAAVAYGEQELKRQLAQLVKMIEMNPSEPFSYAAAGLYYGFGEPEGKMAFLFPGIGSQYVRMGEQLAEIYPRSQAVWDDLGGFTFTGRTVKDAILPPHAQDKQAAALQEEIMAQSDWSMPALNLVSESIRVLLEAMDIKPDAVASHSAGDAASYCAAGVISPEQMIRFAGYRGAAAANCPMSSKGGALMVFSGPEKIREVLRAHDIQQVWIINYNTPALTAMAGVKEHLLEAKKALSESSIRSKLIPITCAPHCMLSLRASNRFIDYIKDEPFGPSRCDVYSYLDGKRVDNDPALLKKVISVTCLKPVRFVDQINNMYADGVRTFVEVGASDGLTLLVERILEDKPFHAFSTNKRKGDANFHFITAIAELIKLGRVENTSVLWDMYKAPTKPVINAGMEESSDSASEVVSRELDRLRALDLQLSKINRMVHA